jgi:glycosyltransferase involved in cell wall biosynthesis
MKPPRVSVIMATYNRPQFIAGAIESVLTQNFGDWELLISDDSESVATERVMEKFKNDARIRYFHREQKGSIANSSNFVLKKARGAYVAILDDDDRWRDPDKLEKQVAFLDSHPGYIGCGGWAVIINEEGKEVRELLKPRENANIRRIMLYANAMINSTGMFRREPAGLYDESLREFADWDFWLKLGTLGKLHNFPEYFLSYRMWPAGASFAHQKQVVDAAFIIIHRYRDEYPGFASAWLLTAAYWAYARFPVSLRHGLNGFLSRTKKAIFSG